MDDCRNVMIIDDNDDIREIIQAFLSSDELQFFPLSDGQSALEVFKKNNIDLVICDMIMPNCDGIEVIQKIRLNTPEAKIIGISGGGTTDYLTVAKDFGADRILYKPFTRNELIEQVKSLGF